MLTIRKQNFESQPCYCCTGTKANLSNPSSAVVYTLYHKLPDPSRHIQARVVIPRCKHCANKMKPVFPISIIFALLGGTAGFLYTICAHGIFLSILCGLIWAVILLLVGITVINYAFSIVYSQMESEYDLVNVLINDYGWQDEQPKEGDMDSSFDDNAINNMITKLAIEHSCEFGEF